MPIRHDPFRALRSQGAVRHLLVPTVQLQRWSEAAAYRAVFEAMADHELAASDLIELAAERGCPSRERDEAARWLAREIGAGALTPVAVPDLFQRGSYPVLRPDDAPPDWDNLRPLSDLRDDPAIEVSWVSIEVLDHTGVPYADLEVTMVHGDGRRDRVVLDDLGRHVARAVPKTGRTTTYWPPRLVLPDKARDLPALDGFQRMPDDVPLPRHTDGRSLQLPQMGRHYRLVVQPPTPGVCVSAGEFGENSSFPTPGILLPLLGISLGDFFADIGLPRTQPIYQVFGHAEADGAEAANKALSDRRAKIFHALLVGDIDTVQAVADEERWGLREHQVILRVLRCDPGAIDGEPGDVTDHAVRVFQAEYRDGVFHRHREGEETPRNPNLEVSGKLDAATAKALVEALVVACSPRIAQGRMHPTHPFAGCSEFNHLEKKSTRRDRRLAIVMHDELPKDHDPQPCKQGDHGACPVDGRDPVKRCSWYRTHVVDVPPEMPLHRHFDLRWLALPNGRLLLSAVTSVPDDGEVTFQVFKTKPIAGLNEISDEILGEALCEPKPALIRGGIAQLVWEPPAEFSLFALDQWLVPVEATSAAAAWGTTQRACIPVFRVVGGGYVAISPPPGDDLARIASEATSRHNDEPLQDVMAIDAFGGIERHVLRDGRVNPGRHPLAQEERRVVGVRYTLGYVPPSDEVPQ